MKLPISVGTTVLNINKSHGDYFTQGIVVPPACKGDQFINIELKYYDGTTRISVAKPWELKELHRQTGNSRSKRCANDVLELTLYIQVV